MNTASKFNSSSILTKLEQSSNWLAKKQTKFELLNTDSIAVEPIQPLYIYIYIKNTQIQTSMYKHPNSMTIKSFKYNTWFVHFLHNRELPLF